MNNIIKKEELSSNGKKQNKIEDFLNGIENILENESNRNEQSTKDEEDLNELSLSNENDCEKNDKDYVNKEFIDLSFLDKSFSILFLGTPLNLIKGGNLTPLAAHSKTTDNLSFS